MVQQLEERFPVAAHTLADASRDVLAFTGFPKQHCRQIWSNNPQERLNNELYTGLASGSHTIVVTALGTKNALSKGTRVVVDAFVVNS